MGSRVCDIKKKFENMTEASQGQRLDSSPAKANHWISKKTLENSNSSSSTSRGLIKRSHAFRSDKFNRNWFCSESSDDSPSSKLFTSNIFQSTVNKEYVSRENDVNEAKADASINSIGHSNKYVSKSSGHATYIDSSITPTSSSTHHKSSNWSTNFVEEMKPIGSSLITKDESKNLNMSNKMMELHEKTTPNSKDANIISNLNENGEDEQVDVNLSNTLKKVLKSPLPSGPPPKKPPRTFAHFTDKLTNSITSENCSERSSDDLNLNRSVGKDETSSTMKPIRSKTESQIMLKKLEIALQNHKTQGKIIEPKTEKRQSSRKEVVNININNAKMLINSTDNITNNVHLPIVRKTSLPDTPSNEKNNSGNGCFGVLSCSNSVDALKTRHIYDTPFEMKSQFYVENIVGTHSPHALNSKENVFQPKQYGKINLKEIQEPIYAKPLAKSHLKNLKCEKGPSVLQIVKSLNSNEKIDLEKFKEIDREHTKTEPLHYMSSPVWEKAPLLQSPTPSPPVKSTVAKKKFDKIGTRSFPSRSLSLDIENPKLKKPSSQSLSIDFIHGYDDFHIDNQKIQKMVNEVYSKCLAMPQDSDCDSVASTPDESLPKTLTTTSASPEEVQKNRQQRTAERKTYLKRVCSRARSFHRPSIAPENHLFEFLLLVGLDLDPARCKVPYIKAKYPADVDVPSGIEQLCFPDAADWPPQACADDDGASRCYCVVITHASGSRKYGYCRRVQPEGAPICLPLAYCIVSPYKANYYFSQVLKELESRHGQPEQSLSSFIDELYNCPFPSPGHGLRITHPATGDKVEILTRKLDPRQEETDIARLLNLVRYSVFLQLFSTLLLERKVILLSYSISKLSTCIEGLCAALYPFHWQHTLVPIVPSTMLDVCQAPTPYVVGLLKQKDANAPPPVPFSTIDQVLVVDVDESRVLQCCGDESSVLPPRLNRGLREALLCAVPDKTSPLSPAHNLVASEALIALFVQLVGHYRDHIITSSDTGQREFQRDGFVKGVSSNTIQSFLDWFSETTMFTAFIESRLDRSIEPYGLFEQRCVEHLAQQQAVSSKGYRANINKTVKSFGDRFKEWTNS